MFFLFSSVSMAFKLPINWEEERFYYFFLNSLYKFWIFILNSTSPLGIYSFNSKVYILILTYSKFKDSSPRILAKFLNWLVYTMFACFYSDTSYDLSMILLSEGMWLWEDWRMEWLRLEAETSLVGLGKGRLEGSSS